jgi:TRAP-type mannitol/chloroaromatic compound transport system permease small subunit
MVIFSPIQYVPADVVINDTIDGEIIILRGTCDYGGSIDFLIPLIVVFAITMFLMMFQSYNARNLSTDLSGSKFIFIILVSFDLVFPLGVPVIVLARKTVHVNIRVYVAAAMNCAM